MERRIKRIFNFALLSLFLLYGVLQVIPVQSSTVQKMQLYTDIDELHGTEPSYFVRTKNGTLIAWGGNTGGRIKSAFAIPYPYLARRTIARGVADFSCGMFCAMYVDQEGVLWGWGALEGLLLTQAPSYRQPVRIMENVKSISVGYEHAMAIKTDGTLWTWGQNIRGELGRGFKDALNGEILNNGKFYEPEKIMEHVQSVAVIDGISFAVTEGGDLYYWGNTAACLPKKVASDAAAVSIAYLGAQPQYQYLTQDGTVFPLILDEGAPSIDETSESPLAVDVQELYNGGILKKDGSLWEWQETGSGNKLLPIDEHVADTETSAFYLKTNGRLLIESKLGKLPALPQSIYTVSPVLRNVILLVFFVKIIAVYIVRKRSAKL